MRYQIKCRFDDVTATTLDMKRYFGFLDRYQAMGIGCSRTGTSTILLNSERKPIKKGLESELGLPVISIHQLQSN